MDLFRGYKSEFDDAAAEAEENISALLGLTGGMHAGHVWTLCTPLAVFDHAWRHKVN